MLRKVLAETTGDFRRHQPLAGLDGADRVEHVGMDGFLQQIAAHAGVERAVDILVAVIARERDDARVGKLLANHLRRRDAVEHPACAGPSASRRGRARETA